MKHSVKLGIVCLARKTFDYTAAEEIYRRLISDIKKIENCSFEIIESPLIEIEDAVKAADSLSVKNIDGLVCLSGTFHLGHLVLELNKRLQKPLYLWGLNELPYDGGKIRLNSVCGVNLNASNLYKAGIRNYHAGIGDKIDGNWIDAIRVKSCLEKSRVAIAGFRAHGFFNLSVYDPDLYRNTGILCDHYELADVFNYRASAGEIEAKKKELSSVFDHSGINETQLEKVSALAARMENFLNDNHIDALALRCWPEFAAEYGVSPCASMSLLQSGGRLIACEGDVDGAVSMLAHRAAGGETPFLFDFSQVNFEENYALLWHCGVAPCNLRDGESLCSLDTYFAGGKGVTADFVLKPGRVSILRFDSADGAYRVFLQNAEGVKMDKALKGTYLKVVFERDVREILNSIIYNGIAHHASMVYGDFTVPFEIFAKIRGWRLVR